MEAAIEEVALLPCGDEAVGLDAHAARPARDLTGEVGLCRVLVLIAAAYLRERERAGNRRIPYHATALLLLGVGPC